MGSVALEAAAKSSSGGSTFIIFIIIIIGAMYFLVMRPGRKRQQKAQQQQNAVQPGARVRTTAGMYATVVATDGDDVILEVAPDVEVRYMKRAIMEVIGDTGVADEEDTASDEDGVGEDDETGLGNGVDETAEEHEEHLETGDVTLEHDGHEQAAEDGAEHGATAVPAASYGDDLTINGKPDKTKAQAKANGDHEAVTPESAASKE
jgi:preprotein translocase subunit YajC